MLPAKPETVDFFKYYGAPQDIISFPLTAS